MAARHHLAPWSGLGLPVFVAQGRCRDPEQSLGLGFVSMYMGMW